MARQIKPDERRLREDADLCGKAFSRMAGTRVDVTLEPIEGFEAQFTKSEIYAAAVNSRASSSVTLPCAVVVKKYIHGIKGTSDDEDTTDLDFRRERAVLSLEIQTNEVGNGIKIFPRLYSRDVEECDRQRIILREFIHGQNLEQLAGEMIPTREMRWETDAEGPGLSESLYPIALLHVKSPTIAEALKREGLLKFGTPEEAGSAVIAEDRAKRFFIKYLDKIVTWTKGNLEYLPSEQGSLREEFFELDRRYVSRTEHLGMVSGELDVFPHHTMIGKLPDAGGIEVGGVVRDLAVYSAPDLMPLWEKPVKMLEKIRKSYLPIRRKFEESLRYEPADLDNDILDLGMLFASFAGNIRRAAATVHYQGYTTKTPELSHEVARHVANGIRFLDSFINCTEGDDQGRAQSIRDFMGKNKLDTWAYATEESLSGKVA